MRYYIEIEGTKVYLIGEAQLGHNSDCGIPYYEQDLSNGQVGEFPVESPMDWEWLFVDGEEFKVKSEI